MATAITDFSQYAGLRTGANTRDPAVLREVAGQFEALFVQTMFKGMRDASLADPIFGQSDQHEMYQDMLDKQYALEMSSGRGIGLADMLVRQLGGEVSPPENVTRQLTMSAERFSGPPLPLNGVAGMPQLTRSVKPLVGAHFSTDAAANSQTRRDGPQESGQVGTVPTWSGPEEFAQQLWPYAERAAQKLNVAPEALVAQAALETGWGKHVIERPDGSSSFNLFGIKANHNWDGGTVSKPTIEYSDGVVRRERATFRAYPDLAATFDDYAEFIGDQPRYESVRNQGDNATGFATALQESGYATDPDYAKKIAAVLNSNVMKNALQFLKENVAVPINSERPHGEDLSRDADNGSQ